MTRAEINSPFLGTGNPIAAATYRIIILMTEDQDALQVLSNVRAPPLPRARFMKSSCWATVASSARRIILRLDQAE